MDALKREIREELAAGITIERYLEKFEWDYHDFRLVAGGWGSVS